MLFGSVTLHSAPHIIDILTSRAQVRHLSSIVAALVEAEEAMAAAPAPVSALVKATFNGSRGGGIGGGRGGGGRGRGGGGNAARGRGRSGRDSHSARGVGGGGIGSNAVAALRQGQVVVPTDVLVEETRREAEAVVAQKLELLEKEMAKLKEQKQAYDVKERKLQNQVLLLLASHISMVMSLRAMVRSSNAV